MQRQRHQERPACAWASRVTMASGASAFPSSPHPSSMIVTQLLGVVSIPLYRVSVAIALLGVAKVTAKEHCRQRGCTLGASVLHDAPLSLNNDLGSFSRPRQAMLRDLQLDAARHQAEFGEKAKPAKPRQPKPKKEKQENLAISCFFRVLRPTRRYLTFFWMCANEGA